MTAPLFAAGATEPVNVVSVPAVGVVVGPVNDTTGCGLGLTTTGIETGTAVPKLSVAVAVIWKEPVDRKVWDTRLLPVTAPRSWTAVPSPQFTVTLRIGLGFVAAGVTTMV